MNKFAYKLGAAFAANPVAPQPQEPTPSVGIYKKDPALNPSTLKNYNRIHGFMKSQGLEDQYGKYMSENSSLGEGGDVLRDTGRLIEFLRQQGHTL